MTYIVGRWGPGFALVGSDTRYMVSDHGPPKVPYDVGGKMMSMHNGWAVFV